MTEHDVETVMKLGGVSRGVAIFARQYARGNVGWALNNLAADLHRFEKEAAYG